MSISGKSKPGRPRAAAEYKRSEQVCLRMTTLELKLIDRAIELTGSKARNPVLMSLITAWAFETIHRLVDETERKAWPIEAFPGILDEHLPKGVSRPVGTQAKSAYHGDPAPASCAVEINPPLDVATARQLLEQLLAMVQTTQPK